MGPLKAIVRSFTKQGRAHANNAHSLTISHQTVPKEKEKITVRKEEKVQEKAMTTKERMVSMVEEEPLRAMARIVIETSTDNPSEALPRVVGRTAQHVETT